MKYVLVLALSVLSANAQVVIKGAIIRGAVIGTTNFVSSGGGGGITLIFNNIAYGTSGGCTTAPATNTVGSTLIVTGIRGYRSPYPAASSSPANTLIQAGSGVGSSGAGAAAYYAFTPTTSSSQTFSADGGDTGNTAFSGIAGLGFTGASSYINSQSNAVIADTVQCTSPLSAKLFVSVLASDDADTYTWSIDSGFTILAQGHTDEGSGTGFGFAIAYKIDSSLTSENPTWTRTSGAVNPRISTYLSGFQ